MSMAMAAKPPGSWGGHVRGGSRDDEHALSGRSSGGGNQSDPSWVVARMLASTTVRLSLSSNIIVAGLTDASAFRVFVPRVPAGAFIYGTVAAHGCGYRLRPIGHGHTIRISCRLHRLVRGHSRGTRRNMALTMSAPRYSFPETSDCFSDVRWAFNPLWEGSSIQRYPSPTVNVDSKGAPCEMAPVTRSNSEIAAGSSRALVGSKSATDQVHRLSMGRASNR